MTQELIANMLGVRREGVTEAARKLQKAGLIDYHRGHITVLDRQALQTRACECYQVVKTEFDRLVPSPARLPVSMTLLIRAARSRVTREAARPPRASEEAGRETRDV